MAENLFATKYIIADAGINTANPNTNYNGDTDPYELWAGWEGTSVAHRAIFDLSSVFDGNDSKGGPNNWIAARFYFRASYVKSDSYLQILNHSWVFSETGVTWSNHNIEPEWNSSNNRKIWMDGDWFYFDIPLSTISSWYHSDKPILLREIGFGEGFAKIYSRHHPNSSLRPRVKFWYMRNPAFRAYSEEANYTYYIEWDKSIEGDDFWTGYRIENSAGEELFNGVGTPNYYGNRYTYLYGLPNGTAVTLSIRGKYYNTGYSSQNRYSTTYNQLTIYVHYEPKNFNVSKEANNAKLTWNHPNSFGGKNPSKYEIYHGTKEGGPYTKIAETTSTSYTHNSIKGKNYYYLKAYYGSINQWSSPTNTLFVFVNQVPTTSISSPTNNAIVDANNCTVRFSFSDLDAGDSISKAKIEYQKFGGSWTVIEVNATSLTNNGDGTYSYALPALETGNNYNLRVMVRDTLGPDWSPYSNTISFFTNSKPECASFSPENGKYFSETSKTISFVYQDATPDDYCTQIQYQLYDKNNNLLSQNTVTPKEGGSGQVKNGNTASFDITFPDKKKKYILRVRAKDHYNYGNSWSEWTTLTYYLYEATNEVTYTYLSPVITSVTPSRANSGETVLISGNNFGDRKGNTKLRYQGTEEDLCDYELENIVSWGNYSISFVAPTDKERAYLNGMSNLQPYPYLTSPGCNQNHIAVIPYTGNDYVYDGNNIVFDSGIFSLHALSPALHSTTPVNNFSVGTNQLIQFNVEDGYSFGSNWDYNKLGNVSTTFIGSDESNKNEEISGRGTMRRGVYFDCIEPLGDQGNYVYHDLGWKSASIYSPFSQGWKSNSIIAYVPEDAGTNGPTIAKAHIYSPWSEIKQTDEIQLTIKDPYFDALAIDEETGEEIKPALYWGEICSLSGKYFGDRKGNSKIFLIVKGKQIELTNNVTFTNERIYFLFGGFNLNIFPRGEFPFGPAVIELVKYYSNGKIRSSCSVAVECWESSSSRRAFLESQAGMQKKEGAGTDETSYGLTIPPGGGGHAQKSLRLVSGDISFLKSGKLEFITRRPKLLQDILIAILTPKGSNIYHPEYGCNHGLSVGDIVSEEWISTGVKSEIIQTLNDYINRQKAQFETKKIISKIKGKTHFYWDIEEIKAIRDVQVLLYQDTIYLKLYLITAREDLEVKAKFKLHNM